MMPNRDVASRRRGVSVVFAGFLVLALVVGCSDDDPVEPRDVYTLTYSLNISGESTVDEVTYTLGGGDVTQQNPADGWTVSFPGGIGQSVGATVNGTVKNGSIILFMSAVKQGGSPIEHTKRCDEAQGTATVCFLEIEKFTLE